MTTMKNLLSMLMLATMVFTLAACNDDDDEPTAEIGKPTISISPASVEELPGETVDFTINATAGSGAEITAITVSDGTDEETVAGNAYAYTVPADAAIGSTITLTFTVKDNQSPAQEAAQEATITVSETPGSVVTVTGITENTTWEAKNTYMLDGLVYVENNAVLTIEPGTTVKALSVPSNSDNTSALIITRGARIMAEGTATDPIIFTTDVDESTLTELDNSLWGGLILLGKAPMFADGNTEQQVEGIAGQESRAVYGGTDPDDNSGILKYVSIRFTGAELAPGNELQGLTLGAVGAGTTIDYVEVFSSSDDGIEFFGGTANVTHAVIAFAEDDSFDWDLGYSGKGQFWFAIQREDIANTGGEWDGAVPDGADLYSNPNVYNATFIGSGVSASNSKNSPAIVMRDATAGTFANSIVTDFNGKAIEVEDLAGDKGIDAYKRMQDGELKLLNNIWFTGGKSALDATEAGIILVTKDSETGEVVAEDAHAADLATHMADNVNVVVDPLLSGISRTTDGGLDPRPTAPEATADLATFPSGFETVSYKGAFDPESPLWIAGWTALSQKGYINE